MKHPLVLANTYIDLLTDRNTLIAHNEINHFEEFHIYNFMETVLTSEEGRHVTLLGDYFRTDGMIEDVAYIIETLRGLEPAEALGHFIHTIAELTQEDEIAFTVAVVAKVTEYVGVERELALIE